MRLFKTVKQRNLLTGALLVIGVIFGFVGFSGAAQAQTVSGECSPNSVINCGALSIGDLRSKYNSDYTKGTQTIYSYLGISSATINSASVKTGYVTKTGLVTVGGATVATGAISTGRQNIAGSTQHVISGTTFYTRPPSVSFLQSKLDAFVFFDGNGRFIGAVIESCGNGIKATPTPPPAKPAVTITKLVDQKKDEIIQVGKSFQYELAVKNTGNVILTNASMTDPAPAGVTLQSAALGKIANNSWSYVIPSLAVGQTMNFTITAIVPSYVTGTLTNKACVDTTQIPGSPDTCATATVEVAPPQIQVCDLSTNKIITINKSDFDSSKYSNNTADCAPIQVCRLSDQTIVTIAKHEMSDKYTTNQTDCTNTQVCRLSDQKIVTITTTEYDNNQSAYSTNLIACQPVVPATPVTPVTPVAPTELPHTGLSNTLAPLVGTGSLVASLGYYVASRRALGRI